MAQHADVLGFRRRFDVTAASLPGPHVDCVRVEAGCCGPRSVGQRRVELDERRLHLGGARVVGEHPDDVPAFAGAQAQQADR